MNIDGVFLSRYHFVVKHLTDLLDTKFIPGSPSSGGILDLRLAFILKASFEGRQFDRDIEFTIILLLVEQLDRIAGYDMALLKIFRAGLTSPQPGTYFGTRMEVNIASTLIKNKIQFEKRESPDFVIGNQNMPAYIECTSVHMKDLKDADASYKILSAISKKSKKSYCNLSTALCMDATFINFSNLANDLILASEATRQQILAQYETCGFGSVLLYFYIFDMEEHHYCSNYVRVDNPQIAPELKLMLDVLFPHGELPLYVYRIPPSG